MVACRALPVSQPLLTHVPCDSHVLCEPDRTPGGVCGALPALTPGPGPTQLVGCPGPQTPGLDPHTPAAEAHRQCLLRPRRRLLRPVSAATGRRRAVVGPTPRPHGVLVRCPEPRGPSWGGGLLANDICLERPVSQGDAGLGAGTWGCEWGDGAALTRSSLPSLRCGSCGDAHEEALCAGCAVFEA